MSFEEFLAFHNQWSASIEQNIAALVEAQQKSEEEIREIRDTLNAFRQVVTDLGQMVTGLGHTVTGLSQVMSNALGLFQDVIRKVDELAVIQRRGDERFDQYRVEAEARHRRSDERMDRLAEILQRFLDSQVRRNGEE